MSETPLADTTSPVAGVTRPIGAPNQADADVTHTDAAGEESATRVFSQSVLISGIRCVLAYVVFPWVLPALGIAGGVGPWIGLIVGVVAIGFNIATIRRFWAADHRWKWPITVINCSVIGLLVALFVTDLGSL